MSASPVVARLHASGIDGEAVALPRIFTLEDLERHTEVLLAGTASVPSERSVPVLLSFAEALEELIGISPMKAHLRDLVKRVRAAVPTHG